MRYEDLDRETFDAVVTGELTHYAIWLEHELNDIICDYFLGNSPRCKDFRRVLLYRQGLDFQAKIDIVRGMLSLFGAVGERTQLKALLGEVEEFKASRNAMAHGTDASTRPGPELVVEIVTRTGKERVVSITPASHRQRMEGAEALLLKLQNAKHELKEVSGAQSAPNSALQPTPTRAT